MFMRKTAIMGLFIITLGTPVAADNDFFPRLILTESLSHGTVIMLSVSCVYLI